MMFWGILKLVHVGCSNKQAAKTWLREHPKSFSSDRMKNVVEQFLKCIAVTMSKSETFVSVEIKLLDGN